MLIGSRNGLFLPLEGDGGDILTTEAQDAVCDSGLPVVVAAGADAVAEAVLPQLQTAIDGEGCTPTGQFQPGTPAPGNDPGAPGDPGEPGRAH